MTERILRRPTKCEEARKDAHRSRINVWRDLFFGMFEVEARDAADADNPAAVLIPKRKMIPGPVGADVMEDLMVHLRDIRIERNEFEIAERYMFFRLLQRLRVLARTSAYSRRANP